MHGSKGRLGIGSMTSGFYTWTSSASASRTEVIRIDMGMWVKTGPPQVTHAQDDSLVGDVAPLSKVDWTMKS